MWSGISSFYLHETIDESHYIANIKGSQKRHIEHSSNLKTLHIWGGYHRVKNKEKKPLMKQNDACTKPPYHKLFTYKV